MSDRYRLTVRRERKHPHVALRRLLIRAVRKEAVDGPVAWTLLNVRYQQALINARTGRELDVYIERAVSVGSERDFLSIGRPDRKPIVGPRKSQPEWRLLPSFEYPKASATWIIEACDNLPAVR